MLKHSPCVSGTMSNLQCTNSLAATTCSQVSQDVNVEEEASACWQSELCYSVPYMSWFKPFQIHLVGVVAQQLAWALHS